MTLCDNDFRLITERVKQDGRNALLSRNALEIVKNVIQHYNQYIECRNSLLNRSDTEIIKNNDGCFITTKENKHRVLYLYSSATSLESFIYDLVSYKIDIVAIDPNLIGV